MKLFTTVGLCVLLGMSANAATYNLNSTGFDAQVASISFANGDILVVPTGVNTTQKNNVTISANITFKVFGTLNVTQNNTVLALSASSILNIYSPGGSVIVQGISTGVKIGSNTIFAAGTTHSATSGTGNLTYSQAGQGFGAPLPLKFTSFDATVKSNTVSLTWEAVNDGPANMFTIQQSTNGIDWSDVATVKATGGDHESVKYTYDVTGAKNGTSIYRIRYIGTDASELVYSASRQVTIAGVTNTTTATIGVQSGNMHISMNAVEGRGAATVMISTMDGKLLTAQQFSATTTDMNLAVNATGIVIVTITDGNTFKTAQKVFIP